MSLTLYLDTSVYGGYFDEEFSIWTQPLFQEIYDGVHNVVSSSVVLVELGCAPEHIQSLIPKIPDHIYKQYDVTTEMISLASEYIRQGVIGQTSYRDCLHIAIATIVGADYLVSWNFKHIVNVIRIRGYNDVNVSNGYRTLEIRSPRDIIYYEK